MRLQRATTTCQTCGYGYLLAGEDYSRTHDEIHEIWQDACSFMDHTPKFGEQLVRENAALYKDLSSRNPDIAFSAAMQLLENYFDVSLGKAIVYGYWSEHPRLNEYLSMLTFGEIRMLRGLSSRVIERLERLFGPVLPGIKAGRVVWVPSQSA